MTELTSMRNIGKIIASRLESAGINTPEALRAAGSKEAFVRLKVLYPEICFVHLYALEGAITDTDYNRLADKVKKDLKDFADKMK